MLVSLLFLFFFREGDGNDENPQGTSGWGGGGDLLTSDSTCETYFFQPANPQFQTEVENSLHGYELRVSFKKLFFIHSAIIHSTFNKKFKQEEENKKKSIHSLMN